VSTSGLVVRRERPADHAAVREVHRAAFAAATPAGDPVEVRLTDELREDAGFLPHLSLVAVVDQKVVGHVIATRGWLEPFGTAALGLVRSESTRARGAGDRHCTGARPARRRGGMRGAGGGGFRYAEPFDRL
jgi:predicted N-acetyltransferase YhbS